MVIPSGDRLVDECAVVHGNIPMVGILDDQEREREVTGYATQSTSHLFQHVHF